MMSPEFNRRKFVQGAAAVGGLAAIRLADGAAIGSNDRVRLGIIGVGNRGDRLLDSFLKHKDAEIVAISDVYEPYIDAAQQKIGGKAQAYHDYRKLIEQKDIDAIVIATPDHWHALQFVEACRAGKDVYVEKPASLTVAEGKTMVDVARETNRVTLVGLQRRSSKFVQEAVQRIREGEIGKVSLARGHGLSNETPMGIGNPADCDPPSELDWDMWLGPAPKVAYNPNRCLYKFRWFWDYSGGQMTNIGTHYLDVIQWALGQDAPQSVVGMGGKYVVDDNREVPDTMESIWQYAGPTLVTFSQHNGNSSPGNPKNWDIEFQGTKGTLGITSRGYEIVPQNVREQEMPPLSPIGKRRGGATRTAGKPITVSGGDATVDHARNFLDCVKSRQETVCPIAVGHRSTTATLLANVSLRIGRTLQWDGTREEIVNDDKANQLLTYEYRSPWRLST
jgi:predicted dehydrogenase